MSLIIYSNGIVEEFLPKDTVFTDEELIGIFPNYTSIRSFRFLEIPNAWCLWGELDEEIDNEFNKIASEIVDEDVYSHVMLIHDSELNHEWNMTDDILYHDYRKFMENLGVYIQGLMVHLTAENQQELEDSDKATMIFLSALGHTDDKRVMFSFNPEEQHENFYTDGGFETFSEKIYEYLKTNFDAEPIEENKPFVIYSDNKTIVVVEDKFVDKVISDMIDEFMQNEKYEICSDIKQIKDKWYSRKTLPKIDEGTIKSNRRGRPPKTNK